MPLFVRQLRGQGSGGKGQGKKPRPDPRSLIPNPGGRTTRGKSQDQFEDYVNDAAYASKSALHFEQGLERFRDFRPSQNVLNPFNLQTTITYFHRRPHRGIEDLAGGYLCVR